MSDNEVLWLVTRYRIFTDGTLGAGAPFKLFRTRSAARKYAADAAKRARRFGYYVDRVTWGPEQ